MTFASENSAARAEVLIDDVERGALAFLVKLATLSIQMGRLVAAQALVDAVAAVAPDVAALRMVRVYHTMRSLGLEAARYELTAALDRTPDDDVASAMLALVDREAGQPGWQGRAQSVLDRGGSSGPTRRLAQALLADGQPS
jgi:predicted Zn-dependent protease